MATMTEQQVGDLALDIYRAHYGDLDDKEFRNTKLAEIEDWLNSGDLADPPAPDALIGEWGEYDAKAIIEYETLAVTTPAGGETFINLERRTQGWYGCVSGTNVEDLYFESDDEGPFPTRDAAEARMRAYLADYHAPDPGAD